MARRKAGVTPITGAGVDTTGSTEKPGIEIPPPGGKTIDGTPQGEMAQADQEREAAGGQQEETPILSDNNELMEAIRQGDLDLDAIGVKREALTAEKKLIYARFDIYGLNKKGYDDARAQVKMSEEDFTNYDLSVLMTRKALGKPIKAQDDLFEAAARRQIAEHQGKSKH